MSERRFEGVWIPAKLWLTKGLTAVEKCLLVEIHSLDASEKHCYATNAFFAEFLGVSEDTVTRGVRKLIDLKLIEVTSKKTAKGTERIIVSKFDSSTPTPQNAETPTTQFAETPTPQNAVRSIPLPLRDLNSTKKESIADLALDYLNQKAGKKYKGTKAQLSMIHARLSEGYTLDDFKIVVDKRVAKWGKDATMAEYLRPSTLFCAKHFDEYLNDNSPARPNGKKIQMGFESFDPRREMPDEIPM